MVDLDRKSDHGTWNRKHTTTGAFSDCATTCRANMIVTRNIEIWATTTQIANLIIYKTQKFYIMH